MAPLAVEDYDPGVCGTTGDHGQARGLCAYYRIGRPDRGSRHPASGSGSAEAAAAPKLKVPACRPCNHRFSKIDRELGFAFGLTTWTDDELMADLAASAARSVQGVRQHVDVGDKFE